jgi:AraC-like DNA-binding protein
MSLASRSLAAGPGWHAHDIVCTAGPHDRAFEERHEKVNIALVSEGTFQYRSTAGRAVMGPGVLLLGNPGQCYECGHEHAAGDRCLSFHYEPGYLERVVEVVPGARCVDLTATSVPPLSALQPLLAEAEIARDEADVGALEEVALRLAAAVVGILVDRGPDRRRFSAQDERRVTRALRRIETAAEGDLSLTALASEVAMSPYHFLRVFRRVVGLTPHQYVLRTRLHRAATRLCRSDEPIVAIAFDCGFNDLSTFNHRFRRVMRASPSAYRRGGPIARRRA